MYRLPSRPDCPRGPGVAVVVVHAAGAPAHADCGQAAHPAARCTWVPVAAGTRSRSGCAPGLRWYGAVGRAQERGALGELGVVLRTGGSPRLARSGVDFRGPPRVATSARPRHGLYGRRTVRQSATTCAGRATNRASEAMNVRIFELLEGSKTGRATVAECRGRLPDAGRAVSGAAGHVYCSGEDDSATPAAGRSDGRLLADDGRRCRRP
jgi:hypothetical protein